MARFENDLLTVRAEGVPLTVVLREIEQLTGVEFEVNGSIASTVSANFADVPLDEGVSRLVRSYSVVMVYAGTARRPGLANPALAKVLVFPAGTAAASGLQDREQTAALEGPGRALSPMGTRNEIVRSLAEVLSPQDPAQTPNALEQLTDHLGNDDLQALVELLDDGSFPAEELGVALAEATQALMPSEAGSSLGTLTSNTMKTQMAAFFRRLLTQRYQPPGSSPDSRPGSERR